MLNIEPIHAYSDNFIWAITKTSEQSLFVVDPGQAEPVIAYIKQHALQLKGILITHHHWDHTNGVEKLKQIYPDAIVYGPKNSPFKGTDVKLIQGDNLNILGHMFNITETPGHTLDHICYYTDDILFCGDTLFSAGCGRLFEGTPTQMFQSLQKISTLPATCKIYCTHEYTLDNLTFAKTVEPNNVNLTQYLKEVIHKRNNDINTIPTSLCVEFKINPFLRSLNPDNQFVIPNEFKNTNNKPESSFTSLRQYKDNF